MINDSPRTLPLPPVQSKARRSPLPDAARSPLILLLSVLLPQPFLLALNLQAGWLMWGEMTGEQRWTGALFLAGELGLLFGSGWYAWRLHRAKQEVPWAANWLIFVPHAIYLTLYLNLGWPMVPASVAQWIVQPETLLFYQFTFLMPAVFWSGLALACFPSRHAKGKDIGFSLLAAAGTPILWYLLIQLRAPLHRLPQLLGIAIITGSSLVCLCGFLRLITMLYVWAQNSNRSGQMILAAVVGLAGPLGGLALNAKIPFPANFQSPFIYGFAALNGILLMVPATNRLRLDRGIWLARCVMLPFTIYFFLVYLPFLPIAVPAMVAAGAGFLILTPPALLILHVRSIVAPLVLELREGWGRRAIGYAGLAAALLPGAVITSAWMDKIGLDQAIGYVFTPDHREDVRFTGNEWAVRSSLEHLRDQKLGHYQPFLSEFYDWVVFDNLTLSPAKMQTLHQAFFGHPMEFNGANFQMGELLTRRRMELSPRRRSAPFPQTVELKQVTTSARVEDGGPATRVVLDLENTGSGVSEYVATLRVSPGVLVSGYWLRIGSDLVPGRIVEKKTAMWVYQMIRDVTQRDPGILTYNAPDTLELRVFPFQSGERRTTEIEFLAPPGVNAAVDINGRVVELAKSDAPAITMARQERSTQIVLSRESLSTLPVVQRRPYLHFIVDRAAASKLTPEVAIARMREIAAEFPEAQSARVTAANYECEEVTNGALPIDQLRTIASIPASRWLPARGSFLQDRAILKVLLDAQDAAAESGQDSLESAALSFPIVISLQSTPPLDTAGSALAYVGSSLPDVAGYYRCDSAEGAPSPIRFDGSPMKEERFPIQPVVVLRQSGHLAFCGHGETASLSFPGTTASAAVEVYDSASQKFRTVTGITRLPEQSRYARGTAVWRKNRIILENPSSALRWLPEIIDESRDSGVLVPASSYIVVENSAQWKMLQLKQQQKLKRNQSLDFMDTPEPSVWVVGLLTLALSVLWSLLRRRLPVQSSARS